MDTKFRSEGDRFVAPETELMLITRPEDSYIFLPFCSSLNHFYFAHMDVLPACLGTNCVQCPQRTASSLGTGVTDCCKPLCGCWESSPGPPEEKPQLLIAEPFFQPHIS